MVDLTEALASWEKFSYFQVQSISIYHLNMPLSVTTYALSHALKDTWTIFRLVLFNLQFFIVVPTKGLIFCFYKVVESLTCPFSSIFVQEKGVLVPVFHLSNIIIIRDPYRSTYIKYLWRTWGQGGLIPGRSCCQQSHPTGWILSGGQFRATHPWTFEHLLLQGHLFAQVTVPAWWCME